MSEEQASGRTGALRFEAMAGCLARGDLKRTIRAIAFHEGLSCDIQENKGLLESLLMVELQGDENALYRALHSLKAISAGAR